MREPLGRKLKPMHRRGLIIRKSYLTGFVNKVWDVGTGSGQAAKSLAGRFSHVHATDIDSQQIDQAAQHSRISYSCAPADASGLSSNFVDAVTVATALHWFTPDLFWSEVARVAKPGALFCAWTYYRAITESDVQAVLMEPILDILEPYWSEGNMPDFECNLSWTPTQIVALITSWSAHKKARMDGHEDKLRQIETKAIRDLGDAPRSFVLPLNSLAGRVS